MFKRLARWSLRERERERERGNIQMKRNVKLVYERKREKERKKERKRDSLVPLTFPQANGLFSAKLNSKLN